jgi:hypothetical protein
MKIEDINDDGCCTLLDYDGRIYSGFVLGKQAGAASEHVWAFIPDKRSVIRFHPKQAAMDAAGVIVFNEYEQEQALQTILEELRILGRVLMFYDAPDQAKMLNRARAMALLLP